METRVIRHVVAMALLWACGCRGCQQEGPKTLLALAPADATGAVWLPDSAAALDRLNEFVDRATQKAGAEAVRRGRATLSQQLGFDPFTRDAYTRAGVDLGAGVLAFVQPGSTVPLLALGLKDADRFDTAVKQFLSKTDSADSFKDSRYKDRTVWTAGRPFGNEVAPTLHWAHVGAFVVLAPADALPQLQQVLDRFATGVPKSSLADDPGFTSSQTHIPRGEALVFARTNARAPAAVAIVMTSLGFDKAGLRTDTFVQRPSTGAVDLVAALGPQPTLPLAGRLDADAVALLLTRAARPEGLKALRSYPATTPFIDRLLQPLTQSIGVDVEQEVLPLLVGPLSVGVHLANVADLPQKLRDVRSLQTFVDAVHVVVVAEVNQPERMVQLLERSRVELEKRGVALRKRADKVGGKPAMVFEPAAGDLKLGWAVYDQYYVYAAGAGRLAMALERLRQGDSELPRNLEQGIGGGLAKEPGTVAVLRSAALADAASVLTAGGDAGTRLGLGALLGSAIELVRTLGDVGLSLSAEADGLRLQIRERMQ